MKPIFMIGMQRSGSNLLRLMLNQLSEIAAPHPPHILQRMTPLMNGYGDLRVIENFHRLIEDVCRLVELNPVPWEGAVFDRADVARRCRSRSLAAVHGAVYDIWAELRDARTWCCKSLANINYARQIEEYFDKPRYIYLYRDGRDVAVSFTKAVVGEKHFYHIAREWSEIQKKAIALKRQVEPARFLSVSYESLIARTEETAGMICDFLGTARCDAMMDYHRSDEAKRAAESSELWANVANPVMKNNSGKFLREAGEEDVRIFESVAGATLDELGYDRSFVKKGEEVVYSGDDISRFNYENARRKEFVRSRTDSDDLKRRDAQESFINAIKARNSAEQRSLQTVAQ